MYISHYGNSRNMKKQGNMTPSKVNTSTMMDSNDSEVNEISQDSKE
jgi:hypothetical protein